MTKYMQLHGMYGTGKVTLLDDEDYEKINGKVVYADKRGYIYIAVNGERHLLHRYILGIHGQREPLVDHKDHNRMNNQKSNLRKCTNSQNQANTKSWGGREFKGVYFFRNKWVARIMVNGERIYLGRFESKEDAIQAYNESSYKHFGEFAYG